MAVGYSEQDIERKVIEVERRYQKANELFITTLGSRYKDIAETDDLEEYLLLMGWLHDVEQFEQAITTAGLDSMGMLAELMFGIGYGIKEAYGAEYAWSGAFYGDDLTDNQPLMDIYRDSVYELATRLWELPQTSAFKIQDFAGNDIATPMSAGYQWYIDQAVNAVYNGGDFNANVEHVVRKYARDGIRVANYPSGYTRRLDSAVRGDIYGAIQNIEQAFYNEIGRQIAADSVEVSAHQMSAPDHEPYQGRVFTNRQWAIIQSQLPRQFGEWNCRHTWRPFVRGVSKRRYTDEELEQNILDNEYGVEVGGRKYTLYEATQKQRTLERDVREAKDIVTAYRAVGDKANEHKAIGLVSRRLARYYRFSVEADMAKKPERTRSAGYDY